MPSTPSMASKSAPPNRGGTSPRGASISTVLRAGGFAWARSNARESSCVSPAETSSGSRSPGCSGGWSTGVGCAPRSCRRARSPSATRSWRFPPERLVRASSPDHEHLLGTLTGSKDSAALEQPRARPHDRAQRPSPASHDLDREASPGEQFQRRPLAREIGLDDEDRATRGEPRPDLAAQAVQQRPAVGAGVPGPGRAAAWEPVALTGYVRGVGEDEIEAGAIHRREEIAAHRADARPVERGVQSRVQDRTLRDVDRRDLARTRQRGRDGEHSAPREDIEDRRLGRQAVLPHDVDEQSRIARGAQDAGQDGDSHLGRGHVMPDTRFDAASLEQVFDAPEPFTIGLEEEVMLLDPETLDLAPVAPAVLSRLKGDERFKSELPASQIEIITAPARNVAAAVSALAKARA